MTVKTQMTPSLYPRYLPGDVITKAPLHTHVTCLQLEGERTALSIPSCLIQGKQQLAISGVGTSHPIKNKQTNKHRGGKNVSAVHYQRDPTKSRASFHAIGNDWSTAVCWTAVETMAMRIWTCKGLTTSHLSSACRLTTWVSQYMFHRKAPSSEGVKACHGAALEVTRKWKAGVRGRRGGEELVDGEGTNP